MRLRTLAAGVATLALALTACGDSETDLGGGGGTTDSDAYEVVADPSFAAGSTMARLSDAGSIKIGVKFDQPGIGNKNPSTGKPEGFDIEIGKIVAGQLGIAADKIEFVETVSANREPFLQQKQVDMVVATYTINDKRDTVVDFAGPYFVAKQDILVAKGNPKQITGPEGLKGKKTCSVSGSTPASTVQEKYGLTTADLVLVDAYSKCRDALGNGQVDAVTTDNVILAGYVDQAPDKFELLNKPFTEEPYGIGVPEGQEAFCEFINTTLKEAEADGSFAKAFTSTAGKVIKETPKLTTPRGCDK